MTGAAVSRAVVTCPIRRLGSLVDASPLIRRGLVQHFPGRLVHGDVLEGAEVIRRCKVFFSAETGPAHIASAVGAPKVTIANSGNQAGIWMLTGQQDAGFVGQRQGGSIIGPSVVSVIRAIERTLQGEEFGPGLEAA